MRALCLAVVLLPLNAWWLIQIEYVRQSDNATTASLFFNGLTLLLLFRVWNALVGRRRPGWRLTVQEMVVVYVAVCAATNLAGHDQLQILFSTITYVVRRSAPGEPWAARILPLVPSHLVPARGPAVDDLYRGNSTLYRWDHVLPWLEPLGWWTGFALVLVWVMLCGAALFRRQWDHERLSYPIAEVPVQVLLQGDTLFRRPLLWVGFGVGAFGQIAALCRFLWPSLPDIHVGVENYRFPDLPWSAMGNVPIATFPFAVGLCFLLPLQIGFSVLFFFALSRVEMVLAAGAGHVDPNGFPFIRQQGVGALFGYALVVLWHARDHLAHVLRAAFGLVRPQDDGEPLGYRTAVFGLAGGFGLLLGFAVHAGMRPATAFLYLGLLLTFVLVVTRIRAEVGLPTIEFFRAGPEDILNRVGGSGAWTPGEQAGMSLGYWLTRTGRQFPMQTHTDALRLGHRAGVPLPGITVVLLLASALGVLLAFWALLHCTYEIGFESAKYRGPGLRHGPETWRRLEAILQNPTQSEQGSTLAYLFGAVTALLLAVARARMVDWPFHPAGYLISGSFGLFRLWLPLLVAWIVKALVLRYGGLKGYRAALPFFLGLVLGEFSAGFLRSALDIALGLYLPPNSGIGGL